MKYKQILITIVAIISLILLVGCNKQVNIEVNNDIKIPEVSSGEDNVIIPEDNEEVKENIDNESIVILKPTNTLEISNEFKTTLAKLVPKIFDGHSFSYIESFNQHIWEFLDEKTYKKGYNPMLDSALEVCTFDELIRFYNELKIINAETKNYIYNDVMTDDSYDQMTSYIATSTLDEENYNYSVENLESIDFTTAWVEGSEGHGIGEKITIRMQEYGWVSPSVHGFIGDFEEGYRILTKEEFEENYENYSHFFSTSKEETYEEYLKNNQNGTNDVNGYYNTLTGFYIVNGYAKNEELFKANSRVKKLKLTLDDKQEYIIELEDTMKPQLIDIEYKQEPSFEVFNPIEATFEILEVYPGDKYEDTCITSLIGCVDTNMMMGG